MFLLAFKLVILYFTLNKNYCVEGFEIHRQSARIIQGTKAAIQEFPYYAGLFNCGAAILSERWVVTAAHCVDNPLLPFVWVGGETFTTSKLVTFDKIVTHHHIHLMPLVNDIALLHLTEPLNFTETIRPVELPSVKDLTRTHDAPTLVFVGRGTDESGKLSKNLQKMDVRRLTTQECLSNMPQEVREEVESVADTLEKGIICTKRAKDGPGLCFGDSGSPLTHGNTLVGLASFIGSEYCEDASLGFYVNVASFVPWIKSVTGL